MQGFTQTVSNKEPEKIKRLLKQFSISVYHRHQQTFKTRACLLTDRELPVLTLQNFCELFRFDLISKTLEAKEDALNFYHDWFVD